MTTTDGLILQRAPNIAVHINEQRRAQITGLHGEVEAGEHALAILQYFHKARALDSAVEELSRRLGGVPTNTLRETIARLQDAGALRDPRGTSFRLRAITDAYDSSPIHVAMLDDRTRVSRFLDGIREVVRPGDVVLDLGAGVGIFAIAAAQAGAKHVYAVETNAIGELAQLAFEANGFADQITLVRGLSSQISLPERCDVLISEMVGNEPTADYMMEVMMDARKRLLKPNARMVPGRVRIFGLPLTMPIDQVARYTFTDATARRWSEQYGMDLNAFGHPPCRSADAPDGFYVSVRPYSARDWQTFSEPVLLADIDMMNVHELQIDTCIDITATATGAINGLLVFFETQLGPTTSLSIAPSVAERDSFRFTPVWVLDTPIFAHVGEPFRLEYRYRVPGKRGGVSLSSIAEAPDLVATVAMDGEE